MRLPELRDLVIERHLVAAQDRLSPQRTARLFAQAQVCFRGYFSSMLFSIIIKLPCACSSIAEYHSTSILLITGAKQASSRSSQA